MYENINYAATREKWKLTRKVLAKVIRDYFPEGGVSAASARSFLAGRYFTNTPNEGVHAKIAAMFAKEGCLVMKKGRKAA